LATVSTSLDESEQFVDNEVELRRVGGVYWALHVRYVSSTARPILGLLLDSTTLCPKNM